LIDIAAENNNCAYHWTLAATKRPYFKRIHSRVMEIYIHNNGIILLVQSYVMLLLAQSVHVSHW